MSTVAAIDVGSNATRFCSITVSPTGVASAADYERYPVRLGADVFSTGAVGRPLTDALLDVFTKIVTRMRAAGVSAYRAVATSAMRDAQNGAAVVAEVAQRTGINLEIISGVEESELSRQALVRALGTVPDDALLIDLGGGSLEVERMRDGRGKSLPLGSVRLLERFPILKKPVHPHVFADVQAHVRGLLTSELAELGEVRAPLAIGTGGNLDILAHLLGIPGARVPSIDVRGLEPFTHAVAAMTVEERMRVYGVRADRADLILPAVIIIGALVQHFALPALVVPGTGLREALLHRLVTPDAAALGAGGALLTRLGLDTALAKRTLTVANELFLALSPLHGLWAPALAPLHAAVYAWYAAPCIDPRAPLPHALHLVRELADFGLDPAARAVAAAVLSAVGAGALSELSEADAAVARALAGIVEQSLILAPALPKRREKALSVEVSDDTIIVRAGARRAPPPSSLLKTALGRDVTVV